MTWNDNWNWVNTISGTDGPRRFGMTDYLGNFSIRSGLTIGDIYQSSPNCFLEGRSSEREIQVEDPQFTCEISIQLLNDTTKRPSISDPVLIMAAGHFTLGET